MERKRFRATIKSVTKKKKKKKKKKKENKKVQKLN